MEVSIPYLTRDRSNNKQLVSCILEHVFSQRIKTSHKSHVWVKEAPASTNGNVIFDCFLSSLLVFIYCAYTHSGSPLNVLFFFLPSIGLDSYLCRFLCLQRVLLLRAKVFLCTTKSHHRLIYLRSTCKPVLLSS